MENLNLIGIKVNSTNEAISILGCTKENLIFNESQTVFNGITFFMFIYMSNESKEFCYSVNASNLASNQYE